MRKVEISNEIESEDSFSVVEAEVDEAEVDEAEVEEAEVDEAEVEEVPQVNFSALRLSGS